MPPLAQAAVHPLLARAAHTPAAQVAAVAAVSAEAVTPAAAVPAAVIPVVAVVEAAVDSPEVVVAAEAAADPVPADKPTRIEKNKVAMWSPYLFMRIHACVRALVRREHMGRIEQFVQLLLTEQTVLEHEVIDAFAGLEGLFGDLGRCLVTDNRVEGCDDTNRVLDRLEVVLAIDGDTVDTFLAQDGHHVLQPGDGLEDTLGDDRFHHIELELSCLGRKSDGGVVADNLEANLVGDLRDDRIDLSRHDGTTRRHWRQVNLVQTAARTGSHQTQVVAHLTQFDRQTLEGRGIADVRTGVRSSLYEVAGQLKRFARQFAHLLDAQFGVSCRSIQTRTDSRTTHVDLIE